MSPKHFLYTRLPSWQVDGSIVRALKARSHPVSYVVRVGPGITESDMITAPQRATHHRAGVVLPSGALPLHWQGYMGRNADGTYVFVPGSAVPHTLP